MKFAKLIKHLASLLLLVALLCLALGSTDSDTNEESGESSKTSVSSGQEKWITGDNWFGCTDKEYFEKLVGYAVQKDSEAFNKALTAGLLTGICTTFENGEIVYIADTAIFSGLVKVRRRGETQEYWTNIEAVK